MSGLFGLDDGVGSGQWAVSSGCSTGTVFGLDDVIFLHMLILFVFLDWFRKNDIVFEADWRKAIVPPLRVALLLRRIAVHCGLNVQPGVHHAGREQGGDVDRLAVVVLRERLLGALALVAV